MNKEGREMHAHWKISDLDFSQIDIAHVRPDENLFYLVTCASFVESGSDLYTQNLVAYYGDEPEISNWLHDQWEVEELQHGQALRAYVNHVWPEFEWETAYRSFLDEYSTYCKVELLEPSKALEMAARCVVEAGTATLYHALARSTDEPVLRDLASRIARDEVNHYKHFFRYFRRFRQQEGLGRRRIFGALRRRIMEMRNEDAACALRHVHKMRSPELANDPARRQKISAKMNKTVRTNLSADMAIKMIMRPLDLPATIQSLVTYPATQIMNRVFFR
ncbi:ferritin-like domain-containing protein [Paraherbaspirillum soli]|uniref:Ferritin-like domain-containing protein n=1 Tax=Paraherbaspirillum soli TaxID=631222 RepID=A0ABW0MDY3_9BURK